jgi:D-alanine-D-alanine ligase
MSPEAPAIRGGRDVALIAGGHPSEHAVSLRTGEEMRAALEKAGYRTTSVVIDRAGAWHLAPPGWRGSLSSDSSAFAWHGDAVRALLHLRELGADTAVLALHGPGGEDGTIQGFLECAGFAYTGSGVAASAVAMDKVLLKSAARGLGLEVAPDRVLRPGESAGADLDRWAVETLVALGRPAVFKPTGLGSSEDVHIVQDEGGAKTALRAILGRGATLLAEAFVAGTECTVPVLGEGPDARALPVIEIRPRLASWFDAASKYTPGGADEIVPARLPPEVALRCQEVALRLHRGIGAAGVTRTDLILAPSGVPVVLELNTLPGLTRESLVPRSARAAGMSLPALVHALVEEGRSRLARARRSGLAPAAPSP